MCTERQQVSHSFNLSFLAVQWKQLFEDTEQIPISRISLTWVRKIYEDFITVRIQYNRTVASLLHNILVNCQVFEQSLADTSKLIVNKKCPKRIMISGSIWLVTFSCEAAPFIAPLKYSHDFKKQMKNSKSQKIKFNHLSICRWENIFHWLGWWKWTEESNQWYLHDNSSLAHLKAVRKRFNKY